MVFPRRHADGRTIQVCVTRYIGLYDGERNQTGYGSFFRTVQDSDTRTHSRNVYSRRLAGSLRIDDALEALEPVVTELLAAERTFFMRRVDGRWRGWLAVGDHREVAESITDIDEALLDTAIGRRRCLDASLTIAGTPTAVWVVPSGPPEAETVLVLVPSPEVVDERDQELAMALAAEAWATLRRVQALDELEGKVEILEAIAAVAGASGLDEDQIARHVTEVTARALSCERAGLYLWDIDGEEVVLSAVHATDIASDDAAIADARGAGHTAAVRMLDTREPFLCQDTRSVSWLGGLWGPATGAVSVHGIPLRTGTETLGILVAAHTRANPRGFTSLCIQVASAVAQQAALALANARLYESQRTAAERFERIDRQRADWISGIVHDLRSPVTAIYGFAKMLSHGGEGMDADFRSEALDAVERQSLRVTRMLEDMMDSALAEAGELGKPEFAPLALHDAVEEAALVATPRQRERLIMMVDPDVEVFGNLGQLTRVVQNLLVNALQHAPEDSTVRLELGRTADQAVLTVADDGPGIPDGVAVFSRFARGAQGGTGLGLYTVKKIVELHGGTIEVDDRHTSGTTLHVHLPLYPAVT